MALSLSIVFCIQGQTVKAQKAVRKSIPIHLAIGSFDPLSERGSPVLPHELVIEKYSEDEAGYYILQFKGPVLQKWKDAMRSAGACIFDYIPQFAFLVEMNHQTRKLVQAMDSVRWIGIYQPGYRIAPDLRTAPSEKSAQPIELLVSIFREETLSILASEIERLGGEILVAPEGKKKGPEIQALPRYQKDG
jgi:hypothetical protein